MGGKSGAAIVALLLLPVMLLSSCQPRLSALLLCADRSVCEYVVPTKKGPDTD